MTSKTGLTPLPDSTIAKLTVCPANTVNLRRDIHRFVNFLQTEGLKRAHRSNGIPKGPAIKLAKILSFAPELKGVEEDGQGDWSDKVSRIALQLQLVTFDVKGTYAGYSSNEPSFPDNYVKVDAKRFSTWLAKTPLAKEQAILDALIGMTENEFFRRATLIPDDSRFSSTGSAVGPASRMPLPAIRKALLAMLAELPTDEWIPMTGLIEHLQATAPNLVLDPKLRKRPLSTWDLQAIKRGDNTVEELDERYSNFFEETGRNRFTREGRKLTEQTPDVFRRVEGRYLQFFLQEIPFLCGFVDLAFTKPGKAEPCLPLESVHAVRLSQRLRQVIKGDQSLNAVAVTVLPNFDVVVEAPSWPDRELDRLAPYCVWIKEDSPCYLLRLDRKQVLTTVAAAPDAPPIKQILEQLVTKPLPANVVIELDSWCGHAQKLTVFENVALVELRAGEPKAVRQELGGLVLDDRAERFLVTKDPAQTVLVLEQRQRVPRVVQHASDHFGVSDGVFAKTATGTKATPKTSTRKKVQLKSQDLVGYICSSPEFLSALDKAVTAAGCDCWRFKQDGLLAINASDLPEVRTILKRFGERFDVEIE